MSSNGALVQAEAHRFRRPDVRAGQSVRSSAGDRFSGDYLVTRHAPVQRHRPAHYIFRPQQRLLSEELTAQRFPRALVWPGDRVSLIRGSQNWGRVKVTPGWWSDAESDWARAGIGGSQVGLFVMPAVGDEVLVASSTAISAARVLGGL
jgi:uncharacterized protein involved in type VI secretion and phage assembly